MEDFSVTWLSLEAVCDDSSVGVDDGGCVRVVVESSACSTVTSCIHHLLSRDSCNLSVEEASGV